ncbi:MAG TPA: STAS domain-containing protein [Nocardioidaceae bacterium]|nr:STAS domain-containing protein [Nocardioidaceae bacterium]
MTSQINGYGALLPTPFDLEVRSLDDRTVLLVYGELDMATATRVSDAIDEMVHAGLVGDVVVDVTALTFCDVRGLAALLGAHQTIRRAGGRLTVSGASVMVRRLLDLSRLDSVMELN